MRVVWLAARSNLRRSWLVSLLLVAMIGVSGGAVLAAWAGAQRTGTAFERMLHDTNAADVSVIGYGDLSKPGSAPKVFDLANLPQVARAGPYLSFGGWIPTADGDLPADDPFSMFVASPVDDNAFSAMDRWVMLSGRPPATDAIDEIALNESAVDSYRKSGITVRVGDTIKVAPFELSALQAKFEEITRENREGTNADFAQIFRPISVRLVGIGRSPADVVSNANSGGPVAVMSRKYGVANSGRDGAQLIGVKLRSPGDLKAFERAAQALHPDAALTFTTASDQSRIFDSGSRPYTDALRLFAIVLGVTAALVLGQALSRQVFADSGDLAVLRALGVTRRSLAAVAGLRSVVVGALGATLALVIALSASGRFPIGPARLAEPHPGVRIAWGISVAGLLVLLFFVAIAVGPVAWRVARPIRPGFERERVRRGPRWLARASLPPVAAVGVRRALWPASRREPSIIVTVLGLGLALAALTVSVIFGASLGKLVDEPERWGWAFDALFDTYDLGVSAEMADALVADPAFAGVTIGTRGSLTLQGTSVAVLGLDVRSGSALPQTTVGRLPDRESEVALGERTLRDLGRKVGDEIDATSSDGISKRLRVVGSVVLPPALALNETFALGNGAVVTADGLTAMSPGSAPSFALVDTKAAPTRANLARIDASYPSTQLNGPQLPNEIGSYDGVRTAPRILAGFLGLLATFVLAHALITTVRARRRELAVLKTIGFSRRQTSSSVTWQATTLAGVGLAVALVPSVAATRLIWGGFEASLGVSSPAVVPVLGAVAILVGTFVVAVVVGALPARAASRIPVAAALRDE